ncbi:Hypothetical protein NTJ_05317 [Nesidiocoris tenuis]|uniref:Uncharacterized protein n=1 Tax=Nesidiocoris tenuis TaxID=355587 RepID=A0ABN7AKC5_9HEMI|nr:Hypothetical protein NTJ_05317 [Nesidiocoris tenuis]
MKGNQVSHTESRRRVSDVSGRSHKYRLVGYNRHQFNPAIPVCSFNLKPLRSNVTFRWYNKLHYKLHSSDEKHQF